MPGFLHDGYSCGGYVAEVPRLHEALVFAYRPATQQQRAAVHRALRDATDPKRAESLAAQAIVSQLIEWDLKRSDTKAAVPLTVESMLRVQPRLFDRLFAIVVGNEASDEKPGEKTAEQADDLERDLAAALACAAPEEFDAKNSKPG
jgi:hypothetical protein